MKKIIFIIVAFGCMLSLSAFDFMDISGDVGVGYMNHAIVNKYDNSQIYASVSEELKKLLGYDEEEYLRIGSITSTDIYNALMAGLSFKMSYIYANINVGFPFKEVPAGFDPLAQRLKERGVSDNITGSVIFDSQIGAGITLMKSSPLNIFVGGGLGINYIRTTRNLPKDFFSHTAFDTLKEIRSVGLIGIGADVGIKYFFLPNIGICVDLKDTVYFLPLTNKRFYSGTYKGVPFDLSVITEKKGGDIDIKNLIKSTWANNFSIRLGVALKL